MTPSKPTHSPIGASSCERWSNCPGSVKLNANIESSGASKYSAEGTVAHMLGEKALLHEKPHAYLLDEIGRSYVEDGFEIEVTEEMVEAVEVHVDYIERTLSELGLTRQHDLRVEVGFHIKQVDEDAYGTCDAVIVAPMNKIIVIDYKHGKGHVVEVKNNKQLLYYALGAYYALPVSDREDLGYIETVIVQPRATHIDGAVRVAKYSVAELLEFESWLRGAIGKVRSGDKTLAAGSWCKFCNAKALCPAQREKIAQASGIPFDKIETEKVDLPDPYTLTPDRWAMLLDNAEMIKSWCAAIYAAATGAADKGIEIPGYKMVEKKGRRRWACERDVEAQFSLEFGDDLYNRKIKSPAQMEKLLKSKRKSEVEQFVEIPSNGRALVQADDARQPIDTSLTGVFSKVPPAALG